MGFQWPPGCGVPQLGKPAVTQVSTVSTCSRPSCTKHMQSTMPCQFASQQSKRCTLAAPGLTTKHDHSLSTQTCSFVEFTHSTHYAKCESACRVMKVHNSVSRFNFCHHRSSPRLVAASWLRHTSSTMHGHATPQIKCCPTPRAAFADPLHCKTAGSCHTCHSMTVHNAAARCACWNGTEDIKPPSRPLAPCGRTGWVAVPTLPRRHAAAPAYQGVANITHPATDKMLAAVRRRHKCTTCTHCMSTLYAAHGGGCVMPRLLLCMLPAAHSLCKGHIRRLPGP
jgi:hypothetical protein